MNKLSESNNIFEQIKSLLESARKSVIKNINQTMIITYYQIGKIIIEDEQKGKERAEYAQETIKNLSKQLTLEFGKGYSVRNLEQMRKFYLTYQKTQSLTAEFEKTFSLSWTHYLRLMRITIEDERNFYEIEALNNNWSVRELDRQIDSSLYERLSLSRNKNEIKKLSQKGQIITEPKDLIKEPYVLEFLGLKEESNYSENDLETAIIDKIEHFLLEMGKGFLFSGRQVRFTFDEEHYFVALVLYNRLLQCFVLIDLKIGKLKHQDLGQIQMYVNYYDRYVKAEHENKTIGIILCKDKNDSLVEITLPEDNKHIFASKYEMVLPSKEDLKKLIENK